MARVGRIERSCGEARKAARAINLGVLPGYVSEAYGVNNHRVVFGLLYDKKERSYPFRWKDGRMKVLEGGPMGAFSRRTFRTGTRSTSAARSRPRCSWPVSGARCGGRARGRRVLSLALPGHTWTNAWSISDDGVVSGWSRKLPNDDAENDPVIWTKSGKIIALKTLPGRADGAAEQTNSPGLTVGYLGNLGTDTDPESDQVAVWRTQGAAPRDGDRSSDRYAYGELVDANDRGQALAMSGTFT